MESWLAEIGELAANLGPIGVLIVSFLGNALPYFTIPYLILVVNYAALIGGSFWGLTLAAILGGVGASLGKLIVYSIGRVARFALSEESKSNLEEFTRIAGKSVFFAALIFAALPLPDDILYVPLGVTGYSIARFFIAVTIGKVFITGAAIALGRLIRLYTEGLGDPLISSLVAVIVSIVVTYAILAIDWSVVLRDVEREGWLRLVVKAFKNPKAYVRSR